MTSSIQLSHKVKEALATYKTSPKQSYEDVIVQLITEHKKKKKWTEQEIKEAYKATSELDSQIAEEFKYADAENLPEWKD